MTREVMFLHVGQAGVQLGHSAWEILTNEHGVNLKGTLLTGFPEANSIFSGKPNKLIPRAIFVDNDSMAMDDIRTGSYRKLFDPCCLISNNDDAANIFPRGYTTVGKYVLYPTLENLRIVSETADYLQGLIICRSLGGGTGSGTASRILDELQDELSDVPISEFIIYPSPYLSNSPVEPYNAVLTIFRTMQHTQISFLTDNQALYDICIQDLHIEKPSYFNINSVVAHTISSLTTSLRFESLISLDINIFQTNLVPFPDLKYTIVSYAPTLSSKTQFNKSSNMTSLLNEVFRRENFLITCFPECGEYMACAVLFRGKGCELREISFAIKKIKSEVKFVDWCPTGFKVAISHQRPPQIPHSCLGKSNKVVSLIANSTCTSQILEYLIQKFDILFNSKAYVHWFTGEGLEDAEFVEARDGVKKLVMDYMEQNTKKEN